MTSSNKPLPIPPQPNSSEEHHPTSVTAQGAVITFTYIIILVHEVSNFSETILNMESIKLIELALT